MTPRIQTTGKNLMAATWTKASRVRRAFKAGRPRKTDLVLTPTRAVLEGSIVLNELETAMLAEGLSEDDVKAALVFMSEAGSYVIRIPPPDRLSEALVKVRELASDWRPLGLVFCQLDREVEAKSGSTVWVQPWLVGDVAAGMLIAEAKAIAKEHGVNRTN